MTPIRFYGTLSHERHHGATPNTERGQRTSSDSADRTLFPGLTQSLCWRELHFAGKGKPVERPGRKGAGLRQTDLRDERGFWDGEAGPHKTAALPTAKCLWLCGFFRSSESGPLSARREGEDHARLRLQLPRLPESVLSHGEHQQARCNQAQLSFVRRQEGRAGSFNVFRKNGQEELTARGGEGAHPASVAGDVWPGRR